MREGTEQAEGWPAIYGFEFNAEECGLKLTGCWESLGTREKRQNHRSKTSGQDRRGMPCGHWGQAAVQIVKPGRSQQTHGRLGRAEQWGSREGAVFLRFC